jgi:hypothetical protein
MYILRPANETHGTQAKSSESHHLLRGSDHAGVTSKPKVVIRAKVYELPTIICYYDSALAARHNSFSLEKASGLYRVQFALGTGVEGTLGRF